MTAGAAARAALVVAALAALATACRLPPDTRPRPRWEQLAPPPAGVAGGGAVWTGDKLVAWATVGPGAGTPRAAAYDPAQGAWRDIADPPTLGDDAASVWTGREAVVWGGQGGRDGAAYDPAADRWRRLPAAPITPRTPAAMVWTGREVVVWGDVSRASSATDGAAYDPAADRWRRLADSPFPLNESTGVWTGQELLVVGAHLDSRNIDRRSRHARALAYDPAADRWRVPAAPPLSPQASAVAWADGRGVAWDYELTAAAYGPRSDRWLPLPRLPLRFSECYPQSVTAARTVFAWFCGAAARYDAGPKPRWTRLRPPSTLRDAGVLPVAAERAVLLLALSTSGDERGSLWVYRPPRADADAP